jgi:hypothetical protein
MSFTPNTDLETLITAVTDAILSGGNGTSLVPPTRRREMESFIPLIRALNKSYVRVRPSRRYLARVQHDLAGEQYTVLERVRYLPPRVQIAALFAIVAGLLVLLRGRAMLIHDETVSLGELPEVAT